MPAGSLSTTPLMNNSSSIQVMDIDENNSSTSSTPKGMHNHRTVRAMAASACIAGAVIGIGAFVTRVIQRDITPDSYTNSADYFFVSCGMGSTGALVGGAVGGAVGGLVKVLGDKLISCCVTIRNHLPRPTSGYQAI